MLDCCRDHEMPTASKGSRAPHVLAKDRPEVLQDNGRCWKGKAVVVQHAAQAEGVLVYCGPHGLIVLVNL